jgi:hypothetical protein
MRSYEHLDLLLGQALECIDDAASEIKELSIFNQKDLLKHIGRSILELWEIRDAIYEIKPDIKRDFVTEYSKDKQRYEDLSDLHRKAIKSEEAGDYESAISLYNELLSKSKYGFFKLLAESGLFRSMSTNKGKT